MMIVTRFTPVGPDTTREMANALMEMGLRVDLYEKYNCAYAAMIDAGDIIFEELRSDSEEAISRELIIGSKNVKFVSVGSRERTQKGLILIDGKNYSLNRKGLNIVVYDKTAEVVLDTSNFDISSPEASHFSPCPTLLAEKRFIKIIRMYH